jgi:hypothetical protein
LFSGVAFLVVIGIMMDPIGHRGLHPDSEKPAAKHLWHQFGSDPASGG